MEAVVDSEEPSPERHHAKRSNDDCGQSRTVLQDHASSGRRGKDTKRAKAAGGDTVAGATPLQPRSPGRWNKLEATGPREASPRPATAIELFSQAKKTASGPELEMVVVYPTAVCVSVLGFTTLEDYPPPYGEWSIKRAHAPGDIVSREEKKFFFFLFF
jgi:hypothetical protein